MSNDLSLKRRRFLEAYLQTWNATEAARQAGYSYPDKVGSRLVRDPRIAAAIEERIKAAGITAEETIARLAQQARANIGDFLTYDAATGEITGIDPEMVRQNGHLIKRIEFTRRGINFELYDGQNALVQLGRHLKLFVDTVDINAIGAKGYVIVSPDDWDAPAGAGDTARLEDGSDA